MKLTAILALVAAATVVSAETNAARMARGLSPNKPARRGTPVMQARHHEPSSGPSQCNTGSAQCCDSVHETKKGSDLNDFLKGIGLGGLSDGTSVGLNCSPIHGFGVGGGGGCSQQPVCCENNHQSGAVNVGCSPINL